MGYELNKLMQQYGLATPTMLSYDGTRGPDVETIDEETGEVTTTPGEITFDPAKQAAFDQYQKEYQFRLNNAPMYAGSQYRTRPAQQQPQTYEDMFTMYLGRPMGDGERNTFSSTGPVSNAQRNEFLRIYEPEFADLGINNTGNQLVMDQIGNYYGNILRNPDFVSNVPTTPVDPSAPFIERNPTVVNPNPPFVIPPSGLITTDQAYYNPDDPPVIYEDIIDEETGEVTGTTPVISDTFTGFISQQDQILANLANPIPDESITTLELAQNVDPFAPMDNGLPAYGAYIGQNLDVLDDIMNQPGYKALNIPVGGFVPGSPEDQAVSQYVAQAAKDHFVNHGFQEGRKFYKRGGPVKGYNQGTTDGPFVDPVYGNVNILDRGNIDPPIGLNKTGLEVQIQRDIRNNRSNPTTTVEESVVVDGPPSSSNIDAMEAALQAMDNYGNPYDPVLKQLSGRVTEAQTGYDQKLAELLANTRKGPDKAELYFNLAAALSAPTKTGTFGESLGLAAKELGKFSSESRKLQQSADATELKQADAKLKSLQSRYTKIQDKQSEEAIRNQEQQFKVMKYLSEFGLEGEKLALTAEGIALKKQIRDYEQNLKPLNDYGKQAVEEGFVRGTAGYQARVTELNLINLKKNLKMPQVSAKMLAEKVGTKQTAMLSLAQLRRALELNENAYAYNFKDQAFYRWKRATGSKEKKFQQTELLLNILSSEALAKLKATFGGQISDGERAALDKLSGAEAATKDVRREIINEAIAVLDRVAFNAGKDIEWFGDPDRYNAPFEGYDAYITSTHRFANPRTTRVEE